VSVFVAWGVLVISTADSIVWALGGSGKVWLHLVRAFAMGVEAFGCSGILGPVGTSVLAAIRDVREELLEQSRCREAQYRLFREARPELTMIQIRWVVLRRSRRGA
jgi:hypothetical protein